MPDRRLKDLLILLALGLATYAGLSQLWRLVPGDPLISGEGRVVGVAAALVVGGPSVRLTGVRRLTPVFGVSEAPACL